MNSALFGSVKQPVAPPQDTNIFSRGSVASLIPGESHLVRLPDPNIPNATWYAIAANYQAAGSSVPSDLEQFLNTFTSALYPYPIALYNQPPSDRYMMTYPGDPGLPTTCSGVSGFMNNDLIVPVCSQIWHAVPGQTYTYPGLAHAPVNGWSAIKQLLSPFPSSNGDKLGPSSPANVTNSPAVNQLVAYWLSGQSGAPPAPAAAVPEPKPIESLAIPSQSPVPSSQMQLYSTDQLLNITPLGRSVELAQPLQLQLTLTNANVSLIVVMQSDGESELKNLSTGVEVGSGVAKIVEDHGLTKTIEVVPLQVGTVQLSVFVSFADGGMSMNTFQLDVVPGYTGVKAFHLDQGFSTLPLELTDKPDAAQHWLFPEVEYDQLDYPVKLKDSTSVTMVVDQPEDNPVISLDGNGMVHGLRPGKARITGSFAGLKDTVEVDVRTTPLVH